MVEHSATTPNFSCRFMSLQLVKMLLELNQFVSGMLWETSLSLRGLNQTHVHHGFETTSFTMISRKTWVENTVAVGMNQFKLRKNTIW